MTRVTSCVPKAGELEKMGKPPWRAAVETVVFDDLNGVEYDFADGSRPHKTHCEPVAASGWGREPLILSFACPQTCPFLAATHKIQKTFKIIH